MTTKTVLGRTLLLTAYVMFGSWLFHLIEETPITYSEISAKMLDDLYQRCNISACLNRSEFMSFAEQAYEAVKIGRKVDWSFLNATSYVFSIVTTIGKNSLGPSFLSVSRRFLLISAHPGPRWKRIPRKLY